MIIVFLLDPPMARRAVDAVRFPARVLDASSFEPDVLDARSMKSNDPAHLIICRNRAEVVARIEAWLTQHGYRHREGGGCYDAPMGVSWQRWEARRS